MPRKKAVNPSHDDRARACELIRELRLIVERLASPPEDQGWLTLGEAAVLLTLSEGQVSRLATSGAIEDNGKNGRGRRVSLTSVRGLMSRGCRRERGAVESDETVRRKCRDVGLE